MVISFNNLGVTICIVSLVLLVFINSFTSREPYDIEDFEGKWKGVYMNSLITLDISNDNTCYLEFKNSLNDDIEIFEGSCNISNQKYPTVFSIKNISNRSFSMYSLIKKVNKTSIQLTVFSTKWRLRHVSFNNENIITLSKTF